LPQAAIHAIRELPDLRVLRSSLVYLSRLDYSTHSGWVDELLSMLEKRELLFPYQEGAVLEALVTLHPSDIKSVGSRIRAYAFGSSLNRKHDWLVYAKGLEALNSFPYKQDYFPKIVRHYAQHPHPIVRRAALACLPRCPKDQVRKLVKEFGRHPDSADTRLAMYLDRLVGEPEYARQELARLRKGNDGDHASVRRTTTLFALAATESKVVAKDLLQTVDGFPRTHSPKLLWLRSQVRQRVEWAAEP
jgi:hypothetical protein